jgi:Proton-conducting membrane transporter
LNDPSPLTPLPVAVPLIGAALIACLRRWLNRAAADSLGILVTAITLAISSLLLARVIDGPSVYWFGNWYPRGSIILGVSFVAEPISTGLCVLASTLTLLSLIFSWRLVASGSNHFQPLMLIFLAAMCGFSLTVDIFNLFVFFELMSTAAFALCGLKIEEPAPLQGAFNFAVTNTIAAFLILTGIALLCAITGALNMAQIGLQLAARHDPLVLFAFTLLTCGFFIKAAIVPFHLWLPDAHAVAPTPVCVLFSGLMVELGLFAVAGLRFIIFAQTFANHETSLQEIFLSLGVLTVLIRRPDVLRRASSQTYARVLYDFSCRRHANCHRSWRSARVRCNAGLSSRPRVHQRWPLSHLWHSVTSPAGDRGAKSVHKRKAFAVDSCALVSWGNRSSRCTALRINGWRSGHFAGLGRRGAIVDIVDMPTRRYADFRCGIAGWDAYFFRMGYRADYGRGGRGRSAS